MKRHCFVSRHGIVLKAICYGLLLACQLGYANLQIEITRGSDNPTRLAVVPFSQAGDVYAEDLASIVAADLNRSGQFELTPRQAMLSLPTSSAQVHYRDWRALGVEYVVVGKAQKFEGELLLEFELLDINQQRVMQKRRIKQRAGAERSVAHKASDIVYEALTGIKGVFGSRMMYVSVSGDLTSGQTHRLYIADADGARPKQVLKSDEPILSPAWSPDGAEIAYVSFERKRPSIYRQNLRTGERERLTNFPGLNGAPAWSPDGQKMAMVLSKDGNPEIYLMDLRSKALTRLTNHPAIETEPEWMPDGRSLVFTSDRGGRPQIYQLDLASLQVKRLTYRGDYNASAQLLADGKSMVMVHRDRQGGSDDYHIAWMELATGRLIVLTRSTLDESPSIAPNGSMLLYATKYRGRGVLAAVALDGGFKYRLPSPQSDVREPAWAPN